MWTCKIDTKPEILVTQKTWIDCVWAMKEILEEEGLAIHDFYWDKPFMLPPPASLS